MSDIVERIRKEMDRMHLLPPEMCGLGFNDMEEAASEIERLREELIFPRELTDDLRDVLSLMIWQSGQIAQCLRLGGEEIKTRAEDEQAHVLHWLICLSLEHGEDWRKKAADRLSEISASLPTHPKTTR